MTRTLTQAPYRRPKWLFNGRSVYYRICPAHRPDYGIIAGRVEGGRIWVRWTATGTRTLCDINKLFPA